MKFKTIPNETWIERQLRGMDYVRAKVGDSPQACLKFLLEAKIITLSQAKESGYVVPMKSRKLKKAVN